MSLRDGEVPMIGEQVDLMAEVAALWGEVEALREAMRLLRGDGVSAGQEDAHLRVAAGIRDKMPDIITQAVKAGRAAAARGR
jgi:hypothetical protein